MRDPTKHHKSFSVIKIFQSFEKKVKATDSYPLTLDELVVNQDEYKGLGSDGEGIPQDTPFASLELTKKTRNTDLAFSLLFFEPGIVLSIDTLGSFQLTYTDISKTEEDVAEQLFALASMLSNGQIALLITTLNNQPCAIEMLFYDKSQGPPTVISTEGKYPWWVRLDSEEFDFYVMKNNFPLNKITPPKQFLLFDYDEVTNKIASRGRSFSTKALGPLTKKQHAVLADYLLFSQAGKSASQSIHGFVYKTWEFWILIICLIFGIYVGNYVGLVPDFVTNNPIVLWPLTVTIIYLILLPLLTRKEYLRKVHPKHPWVLLDTFVKQNGFRFFTGLNAFALLATCFMPAYQRKDETMFTNLFTFANSAPWVLLIPISFVISIFMATKGDKRSRLIAVVTLLAGLVGMFVVNDIVGNPAEAPEPFNSFTAIAWLVSCVIIAIHGYGLFRSYRLKKQSATSAVESLKSYKNVLNRLRQIQIASYLLSGALLIPSAIIFARGMPKDALNLGTPLLFALAVAANAVLLIAIGLLNMIDRIKPRQMTWISTAMLFAILAIPAFLLKDNVSNEGPNSAFILLFNGAFLPALASMAHEAVRWRVEAKEIKHELFSDDDTLNDS